MSGENDSTLCIVTAAKNRATYLLQRLQKVRSDKHNLADLNQV